MLQYPQTNTALVIHNFYRLKNNYSLTKAHTLSTVDTTLIFLVSGSFCTLQHRGITVKQRHKQTSYWIQVFLKFGILYISLPTKWGLCTFVLWWSCRDWWCLHTDSTVLQDTGVWKGETETLSAPLCQLHSSDRSLLPATSGETEEDLNWPRVNKQDTGRCMKRRVTCLSSS